jgi:uncharacterized protein YkwD
MRKFSTRMIRLPESIITSLLIAIIISLTLLSAPTHALSLAQQLSGKILLQVEDNGEAWYVYPATNERFFMGRPNDAFDLMRNLGLGISNTNLDLIPEHTESKTGNMALREQLSGKILLQVEENGEAWYVSPDNLKRYYMGRPADAFGLMRSLGLGISTLNLISIPVALDSVIPDTQTNVTDGINTPGGLKDGQDAERVEVLNAINSERKSLGLQELALSIELNRAAQNQANDMQNKNYFDFTSPTGDKFEDFLGQTDYVAHAIALNLVQTNQGASSIVNVWKDQNSSSLNNVRSDEYFDLGIGIAQFEGVPIFVITFAESLKDFFETETSDLGDLEAVRSEMLTLVNDFRVQEGVSPLNIDSLIELAAQRHAEDMLNRSYYAHETPEGLSSHERIIALGYNPSFTGENIAKGQLDVSEVMTSWINSPDHRANLVSENFTEVGFGMAIGENQNGFEVIWVQNFGQPM